MEFPLQIVEVISFYFVRNAILWNLWVPSWGTVNIASDICFEIKSWTQPAFVERIFGTHSLWPSATMNCGNWRPQIASLWPQKCCGLRPQWTLVAWGRKWSVCDFNLATKMANLSTLIWTLILELSIDPVSIFRGRVNDTWNRFYCP